MYRCNVNRVLVLQVLKVAAQIVSIIKAFLSRFSLNPDLSLKGDFGDNGFPGRMGAPGLKVRILIHHLMYQIRDPLPRPKQRNLDVSSLRRQNIVMIFAR